jgi:hypothetical protein
MRGLGRLGAAALAAPALFLVAACAHVVPAPTAPATQSVAPISAPINTGSAAAGPEPAGDQLNQIDDQIDNELNQIDNEIGQVNQGLATSEGDPAQ